MAQRRFQVEDLSAAVIRVSGDQARHALRVLRLKVGASVTLFDGRGGEAVGRITSTSPAEFAVDIVERKAAGERVGPPLVLAVAMPKGPRGDWLVEKCAELGVSRLWPLACERALVEPGEGKLTRWRRKAVEAAKQSAQSSTMMVEAMVSLAELLDQCGCQAPIFFGEPHRAERTLADELRTAETRTNKDSPVLVIIGPEGGLTEEECRQIESAGGKAVRLAPTILRIETAAIAAAAVWACSVQSSARE